MELSTELDKERHILVVHVRGEYRRPHDGFEAQRFVISSYAEYGCRRILLDLTQATVVAGTMSTLETANPHPDVAKELRNFSFAAVYAEITADERFFEDAAVNRGLNVRVFDRMEPAVEWLMQA